MACVPPQTSNLLDKTGVQNRNICEVLSAFVKLSHSSTAVFRGKEGGFEFKFTAQFYVRSVYTSSAILTAYSIWSASCRGMTRRVAHFARNDTSLLSRRFLCNLRIKYLYDVSSRDWPDALLRTLLDR